MLSDLERRALAFLPRYRTDVEYAEVQEHMREANGYDASWRLPRSASTVELLAKLTNDPYSPTDGLDAQGLEALLSGMSARGLCDRAGDAWAMSSDGLAALQA